VCKRGGKEGGVTWCVRQGGVGGDREKVEKRVVFECTWGDTLTSRKTFEWERGSEVWVEMSLERTKQQLQ
jgi:hypothetical protein